MKIIALTDYPQAGKDSVFKAIKGLFPNNKIGRVAYADNLKLLHMKELGIPDFDTYNNHLHNNIPWEGINLRNEIATYSDKILKDNPKAHVEYVEKKLDTMSNYDLVVITDLRYPVEHTHVTNINASIIRVYREAVTQDIRNKPWNRHVETFAYNAIINNTKSLALLEYEVDRVLHSLGISFTQNI